MKIYGVLTLLLLTLVGCNADENIGADSTKITTQKIEEIEVIEETVEKTAEETRDIVVDLFKNNRNDFTTPKFLEDSYMSFPDDEVIHAIYHYNESMTMMSFAGEEWKQKAISYASKISPDYTGAFADEIIPYVANLLGDEWYDTRNTSLSVDETMDNLSLEEKVEIFHFIEAQYDEFHSDPNADTKSNYSEIIWEITSEKFGLPIYSISEIWSDIEVISASED